MGENFTIPVVIETAIKEKLSEILKAVEANQEAIEELKKIRRGTGFVTGVDLNEEEVD